MDPTSLYGLWNAYQQLAQQQYQWGQQQYANNSQLTDQVVNDYLDTGAKLTGMAGTDLSRYQGIFQPLENQLVAQAQSYAGAPRIAAEMGTAGATAAQASEAGRQNALAQLQSFGIDPSSGRYAALNNVDRMQQAASVAGAENTARQQTEATGRGLMNQAITVGERYPGQITQALQQSLGADAGAINAKLANAQTGVQLMGSPTQWASDATSAASNTLNAQYRNATRPSGFSISEPPAIGGGGSGGGSGGGGGGGGYSSPYMSGDPYQQAGGSYPTGQSFSGPWGGTPGTGQDWQSGGGGGSTDGGGGGGSYQDDTSSGVSDDAFAQAGGAIDTGDDSMATSAMPPPSPMGPTTGGQVGAQASPSAGAIPDDVPARLSAHEYVIPRDVALWKGREHFQKVINKARQDMAGATAKPKMKPALNQRPTFRSAPMAPRPPVPPRPPMPPQPAIPGAM